MFTDSAPLKRVLIDDLLGEQQQLTAVEQFSRRHDAGEFPAQQRYYRDLIPLEKPGPGEQYAFDVDLDACTGCKACVSACHSLNGLDEDEIWRSVGLVHGGTAAAPYQQTVTTACHHCVEPACLEGCPVLAYEKDPVTGVVLHLDDQCIGCQYCVLKCPYDVPKYSAKRGIVRKCDMCHSRLAVGEAPACVQACPTSAIRIRVIDQAELRARTSGDECLVPGAFASAYTIPATSYRTDRRFPADARAGDSHRLRLEHPHWPLVFMLVLTQMAVGMFVWLAAFGVVPGGFFAQAAAPMAAAATAILSAGLGISVLHLGRPLGAWRAFLGLRTSWMSREIVAFAALAAAGMACSIFAFAQLEFLALISAAAAGGLGIVSVYCSAMIYVDTRRAFWTSALTFPQFFGTALLLGSSGTACLLAWLIAAGFTVSATSAHVAALTAVATQIALLTWKTQQLRRMLLDPTDSDHRSAATIWTLQRQPVAVIVVLSALATACGLAGLAVSATVSALCATVSLLAMLAVQLLIRRYFFTAVVAPRMPGGVAT